jgi:maleylacetoacetate isomerase
MKLYTYFRSSAAYRVRIALALKGIATEAAYVHLVKDGGQQKLPGYTALNPQALLPALEVDGAVLTQSLAILEYLEETHPATPLLPATPIERAKVRAFALAIACEIHPLNNLRVLAYLKGPLGHDQATADTWYRHWTETGLAACEKLLPATPTGPFCFGATPTLADVCLVPQMFNARRFNSDLSGCPRLVAVDAHCRTLAPFLTASPEQQADAG